METSKNSGNEKQHRLIALKSLVEKGITLGLDLTDVLEKIENVIKSSKDNIIRMVLLGTFSDGKTSVVAGLLGKLEDSMKIDQDESSDELKVYRPNGLKEGFEIVDTPGLFGTKEKEVDGKNIRYSELTQKYISEAHVVIYVCDAVTPLKESHKDIIKLVMRDFNKLESTIFVINKMDEAGTDMLDEEDYNEMSSIKKDNLLKRLSMLKDVLKQGGSYLGKVNISGEMVKAARDIFAKSYKFKPWGAVNLGKSMTKLAKVGGAALALAIEVVSFISAARNEKKLKDLKADIVGEVDKIFKSIFEMFDKDDKYYENFASSYIEMTKRLHARMQEISVMRHKVANLEDYGRSLKDWFKEDAEDADFEEI